MTSMNEFYDFLISDIPPQFEEHLDQTYSDWFNSLDFCTLYNSTPAERVWICANNGHIVNAIFYREERWARFFKNLQIFGPAKLTDAEFINLMSLRKAHIATFSRMSLSDISGFNDSQYRHLALKMNEDIIIELPKSPEDYLEMLGKNAKIQFPYYLRRIERKFNGQLKINYLFKDEISFDTFSDLVNLNKARIESKGATYLWTDTLARRRHKLAQKTGFLCSIDVSGTMVGGVLSFLYKHEAYANLIGHEIGLDKFNIGNICLWLTINRLIELGFKNYHLLWGKSFYKFKFGGKEHLLFQMVLFRYIHIYNIWHGVKLTRELLYYVSSIPRKLFYRVLVVPRHIRKKKF